MSDAFQFDEDGRIHVRHDFIKTMLDAAQRDADSGNPVLTAENKEGSAIAEQYRKSFPDVSDHDLGCLMYLTSVMISRFEDLHPMLVTRAVHSVGNVYAHAGTELLKTEHDLGSL